MIRIGNAAALLLAWATASASDVVGVASVIDGDTVDIHGTRIRLQGIDAPESSQMCMRNEEIWRCGQDVSFALANFVGRKTVRCENLGTDKYKRMIGRCWLGSTDLNQWMVWNGFAVAYRQYSTEYVSDEDSARTNKRGIWAGDFMMPSDWRRARRDGR